MEYKTSKFSLSIEQQHLRIGLVNLIRSHVEERGLSHEELSQVIEGLQDALQEHRYPDKELEDWILDERFKNE